MQKLTRIFSLKNSINIVILLLLASSIKLFAGEPDATWVTDITHEVGLDSALGSRIWLADINGDDYPDLVWGDALMIMNHMHIYLNVPNPDAKSPIKRIFIDFTDSSGINKNRDLQKESRISDIAAVADVNNDGYPDIVNSIYYHRLQYYEGDLDPGDRSEVYLNDGKGHFTLVPNNGLYQLGLVNTTGLGFLDYDMDGNLDLFMGQWFYDYANDRKQHSILMHGKGDGTFEQIHDKAIEAVQEPFYGTNVTDWDNDGLQDIITSPYCRSTGNLFKNMGDGTFLDVAESAGYTSQLIGGDHGQALCQWAANPGDYNNDGNMDLLQVEVHGGYNEGEGRTHITENMGPKNNYRLEWRLDLLKRDAPVESHLGDQGGTWFDLDGDGKLDVAICQMAYPQANPYGQERLYILRQNSDGYFYDISKQLGIFYIQKEGHTASAGDYDLDGDQDLFFSRQHRDTVIKDTIINGVATKDTTINNYIRIHLLQNNIGNKGNWVSIKLDPPTGCNKSCIGAKIVTYSNGLMQTQEIQAGVGHFATEQPFIKNFGIGDQQFIDSVKIRWPKKGTPITTIYNVPLNLISAAGQDGVSEYVHSWEGHKPLIGSNSFIPFGKVNIGDKPVTRQVSFKNIGDSVMTISSISLENNDLNGFSIDSGSLPEFPVTLAPNNVLPFSATFKPNTNAYFESHVVVKSDAYNDPNHRIKLIGVTEHGIMAVSDSALDFDNAWVDTARRKTITISNTGDYELTINSIVLNGNGENAFSMEIPSLPIKLQPGNSKDISVTFKPRKIASYNSTLVINSDYYKSPNAEVSLNGMCDGPKPGIAISTLFISFGNVNVDNQAEKTFDILNNGTGTLVINDISTDFSDVFSFPDTELPLSVEQNQKKPLTIRFKPKESKNYKSNLNFHSNAYGEDSVKTYTMNANGVSAVEDQNITLGEMSVRLFPNPATSGHATLRCIPNGMADKEVHITIVNLAGVTMIDAGKYYLTGVEFSADLDVHNLAAGMYYLVLDSGDGIVNVPMVIVK